MAMVVVDASCLKQADSQPKSCGLVWGSAAAWRCSDEPSELSQWPGHDDSTINIVVIIIIIIIWSRRNFPWNWTIPVVMLATVVATTATLSSNSCKSASFLTHFSSILRKQFATNDTFLREVNSYKWVLTLRNSRQTARKGSITANFSFTFTLVIRQQYKYHWRF